MTTFKENNDFGTAMIDMLNHDPVKAGKLPLLELIEERFPDKLGSGVFGFGDVQYSAGWNDCLFLVKAVILKAKEEVR